MSRERIHIAISGTDFGSDPDDRAMYKVRVDFPFGKNLFEFHWLFYGKETLRPTLIRGLAKETYEGLLALADLVEEDLKQGGLVVTNAITGEQIRVAGMEK